MNQPAGIFAVPIYRRNAFGEIVYTGSPTDFMIGTGQIYTPANIPVEVEALNLSSLFAGAVPMDTQKPKRRYKSRLNNAN